MEMFIFNVKYLSTKLACVKDINLPNLNYNSNPVLWTFPITANRRDKLQKKLNKHGIGASQIHYRNDKYSIFQNYQSI